MGAIFSYSLGSGIFLLFGFLVYRLLLAGEKQPGLNRAALLGLYGASLAAMPLMSLLDSLAAAPVPAIQAINIGPIAVTAVADPAAPSLFPRVLLWIYLAGVAAVLLYTLAGFSRLAAIIRGGRRISRGSYTLIVLPTDCVPFSFAGYYRDGGSRRGENRLDGDNPRAWPPAPPPLARPDSRASRVRPYVV